jgi:DNA polymerase-1
VAPLWLVMDVSYMAWRAFHSTGTLTHEGVNTGVLFGMFRDIFNLRQEYPCQGVVFCFDSHDLKRKQLFPGYKSKKSNATIEELELRSEVHRQVKLLRKQHLPSIGFNNLCWQLGYEGDDMIASVVKNLPPQHEALIVGNDHDLYQLLNKRVRILQPSAKKIVDVKSFEAEYGITPAQWVQVKSIAGCGRIGVGDGVPGVPGVGEKKACQFIRGLMKTTSKTFQSIAAATELIERNKSLVCLPFKGVNKFELVPDTVSLNRWDQVLASLGMKSLRHLTHSRD